MPLHPFIVHFPLVLLLAATGFYVAGAFTKKSNWEVAGFVLHVLGLVTCIAAILTGDAQAKVIAQDAAIHGKAELHETMVMIATYGFGGLAIWAFLRQKSTLWLEKVGFLSLFLGLNALLLLGAHVGGEMVYVHGAGVAPMQKITNQLNWNQKDTLPQNTDHHE
jgi:uncharacterized membrane protein